MSRTVVVGGRGGGVELLSTQHAPSNDILSARDAGRGGEGGKEGQADRGTQIEAALKKQKCTGMLLKGIVGVVCIKSP